MVSTRLDKKLCIYKKYLKRGLFGPDPASSLTILRNVLKDGTCCALMLRRGNEPIFPFPPPCWFRNNKLEWFDHHQKSGFSPPSQMEQPHGAEMPRGRGEKTSTSWILVHSSVIFGRIRHTAGCFVCMRVCVCV